MCYVVPETHFACNFIPFEFSLKQEKLCEKMSKCIFMMILTFF